MKNLISLILTVLFSLGALAEEAVTHNLHLYKIEKQGLPTSYMFGTFHMGTSVDSLPEGFFQLRAQTDVHLYEKLDMNAQRWAVFQAFHSDPEWAAEQFPIHFPEVNGYAFNEQEAEELVGFGIPRPLIGLLPNEGCRWFVTRDFLFKRQVQGLDYELMLRSQERGVSLIALNDQEFLAEMAQAYPEDCFVTEKLERLRDPFIRQFETMGSIMIASAIQSYWDGDVPNVEGDDQLDQYNDHWMNKLEEMLPQDSLFITVGNSHIYGEKGLIQKMRQGGYSVTRIPSP